MEGLYQRVTALHGKIFFDLSRELGLPFDGLSTAARFARREAFIGEGCKRKLERLDTTYHVVRHLSQPVADRVYDDFCSELNANKRPDPSKDCCAEFFGIGDAQSEACTQTDHQLPPQADVLLLKLQDLVSACSVHFPARLEPDVAAGLSAKAGVEEVVLAESASQTEDACASCDLVAAKPPQHTQWCDELDGLLQRIKDNGDNLCCAYDDAATALLEEFGIFTDLDFFEKFDRWYPFVQPPRGDPFLTLPTAAWQRIYQSFPPRHGQACGRQT